MNLEFNRLQIPFRNIFKNVFLTIDEIFTKNDGIRRQISKKKKEN